MERLPNPLICLTIEHVIDDLDAIEKYLAEYPEETKRCMPIALRNVVNEYAVPAGFPAMGIPSPGVLDLYLRQIWRTDQDASLNMAGAVQSGYMTNLAPYFLAHGAVITPFIMHSMIHYAVSRGDIPLLKLILYPPQGRAAVYRDIVRTPQDAIDRFWQIMQERRGLSSVDQPISLQDMLTSLIATLPETLDNRDEVMRLLEQALKEIQ